MRLSLRIGRVSLEVSSTPAHDGPHEVLFLNPEVDTAESRDFIESLHDDLGSYDQ